MTTISQTRICIEEDCTREIGLGSTTGRCETHRKRAQRNAPGYWTPERRAKKNARQRKRDQQLRESGEMPEINRRRNLKVLYKISPEQYDAQLEAQSGLCAICDIELTKEDRGIATDHDHSCCLDAKSCGKCLRGLLCQHCNRALGSFQDNISILERAIEYLKSGGVWE